MKPRPFPGQSGCARAEHFPHQGTLPWMRETGTRSTFSECSCRRSFERADSDWWADDRGPKLHGRLKLERTVGLSHARGLVMIAWAHQQQTQLVEGSGCKRQAWRPYRRRAWAALSLRGSVDCCKEARVTAQRTDGVARLAASSTGRRGEDERRERWWELNRAYGAEGALKGLEGVGDHLLARFGRRRVGLGRAGACAGRQHQAHGSELKLSEILS